MVGIYPAGSRVQPSPPSCAHTPHDRYATGRSGLKDFTLFSHLRWPRGFYPRGTPPDSSPVPATVAKPKLIWMKGLCANRAQKIDHVGILYTHRRLRWNGAIHGFYTGNERSISFRSRRNLPDSFRHSRWITGHTITSFSHMRHERPIMD